MKSDSAILDGKAMRLGSEPSRRLNAVRGLLLSGVPAVPGAPIICNSMPRNLI